MTPAYHIFTAKCIYSSFKEKLSSNGMIFFASLNFPLSYQKCPEKKQDLNIYCYLFQCSILLRMSKINLNAHLLLKYPSLFTCQQECMITVL